MRLIDSVIKDIKNILYDRKSLLLIILMPLVLTTILSFALRGNFEIGNEGISKLSVGVVKQYNYDREKERFENLITSFVEDEDIEKIYEGIEEANPEKIFFETFLGNETMEDIIEYKILSQEDALVQLENNDISGIIILPKNYIYDTYVNLLTPYKNKVTVDVIKTTDSEFRGSIVENIIEGFNNHFATLSINKEVVIGIISEYIDIETAFVDYYNDFVYLESNEKEITITERAVEGKEQMDSFAYYSMAIMTMFLLFGAGYGGKALLLEKKEHTFYRLKVAGVNMNVMYVGAFFTTVFIALLQSTIMIGYSRAILNVHWGHMAWVLLVTILIAIAIGALGVLISAISIKTNSFKWVNLFENGIVFVMALIGGSFTPIYFLPQTLQNLSDFTINGLGLKMYSNVMQGIEKSVLYTQILYLLGIIMVLLISSLVITKTIKEVE
ncbi:ABC-2 type transport system permease protein [Natranaerovirga hydrolytica]|uniref:ABC-2 type transport system permease protein n=1 Tax=Natranaerovirga hydrolytica TaxID=680378 RepID=A0A4R1M6P0_9FIRM|nr:ABC transporter permease [Natranaerovirga hydrolytica]TCK87918.1 ABC-2 type transport system permease protein [Natranaerovirga hydrolytica]